MKTNVYTTAVNKLLVSTTAYLKLLQFTAKLKNTW